MRNNRRFDNQIEAVAASLLRSQYADEIERAIDRAKRPLTARDRWFRKEWYRAGALRRRTWQPVQDEVAGAWEPGRYEYTSGE